MKKLFLGLTVFLTFTVVHKQTIAQGVWTQKADFGGGLRYYAVGFSIGTKGYISTGTNTTTYDDLWEYDPSSNIWTQKASIGVNARYGAVGFSIGTKGYVGIGIIGLPFKDFWEYDQGTNMWTQKTDFGGSARFGAVAFAIGNKGYVGTGVDVSNFTTYYNDFWQYDPSTNLWTQKANFAGTARYGTIGFSIGNKGYIATGDDGVNPNGYCNDLWEYDTLLNSWSPKSNITSSIYEGRYYGVGFSIGKYGYIGTGDDILSNTTYLKDFREYNPFNNSWTQKTSFGGIDRRMAVGFSIGNSGYIGTGLDNTGNALKDFWEYTPDWLGINEIKNEISISIYPNPFSTQTTLQTDIPLHNATLTVDNCFGQTVAQIKNINGQTVTFSRDNLASGLYFVRLTEENKIIAVDKLVIADK